MKYSINPLRWLKRKRALSRLNSKEGRADFERIRNAKDGECVQINKLKPSDINSLALKLKDLRLTGLKKAVESTCEYMTEAFIKNSKGE